MLDAADLTQGTWRQSRLLFETISVAEEAPTKRMKEHERDFESRLVITKYHFFPRMHPILRLHIGSIP